VPSLPKTCFWFSTGHPSSKLSFGRSDGAEPVSEERLRSVRRRQQRSCCESAGYGKTAMSDFRQHFVMRSMMLVA
jgi:hypothetical protein